MRLDDPTAALLARRAQPSPRLLRAEDEYAHPQLIEKSVPLAEWAWRLYPPQFVDRLVPDLSRRGQLDANAKTQARIEAGKWIADCPFCRSAQVVSPLDPRFLCAGLDGCANGAVGGAFASVEFPTEGTCEQIETVLLERPQRVNRNWRRPETVDTLLAENAAHLGTKAR